MKTPKPQEYLNEEGREIYENMCRLLDSVGALEEIDSYGLSMAAHWLWIFHYNANAVKKTGGIQITSTGYSQCTAEITNMDKASGRFEKLSAKYGLSNKDRELMLKFRGSKKDKDALDEL